MVSAKCLIFALGLAYMASSKPLPTSVGIRNKSNGLSVENEPTRLLTRDARAESGDKEFHDNGWFVLSGDVVSKEDEEKAPQMH